MTKKTKQWCLNLCHVFLDSSPIRNSAKRSAANILSTFYSREQTALIFLFSTCSFLLLVTERLEGWVEPLPSAHRVEEGSRSIVTPLLTSAGVKDTGKWSSSVRLGGLVLWEEENRRRKKHTVRVVMSWLIWIYKQNKKQCLLINYLFRQLFYSLLGIWRCSCSVLKYKLNWSNTEMIPWHI